ncbi:hypothetical protein A3K82_03175 [Candidatus Pacearchaeota archaeon RBG_19FT_COMBO_34_9]|nr:MAG: hypothetical protein A3K82_03175 [Candidatus Pacearchaeota archaeon RBG_19FT_COMBO_34_9]OGJ17055.1 MAG: hypothetical protein A3K74_01555 [Candidatus Pacearchaeota archaeon RBG_13_33_26]
MKLRKGIESFIRGMGSVIQLFPEPIKLEDINPDYSDKYTPTEQDAKALANDWNNVGLDINKAIKKFEKQYIK